VLAIKESILPSSLPMAMSKFLSDVVMLCYYSFSGSISIRVPYVYDIIGTFCATPI
jgi:hypothetical protein